MEGGTPDDAWKVISFLLGLVTLLGGFIAKALWNGHHDLVKKVAAMELNTVANGVTKTEMRELLREMLRPINSDLGAIIDALAAQNIHVARKRD